MRKSFSLALALLGLFDSLYLFWTYTLTKPIMCFGFGSGCDAVRNSPYAHLGGLPMPALGVAGYVLVALLIIAESLVPAALAIEIRYALAGATAFGFLFSLYLEYLQGFLIHAFCAWCVTSGVVMTLLFALAVYNVARPGPEADPPAQIAQLRRYFAVAVAEILIGVPAFYTLVTHGEASTLPPPPTPTEASADKLVRPDSHVTNNPDAPLTVVEFGDLECPVCGSEQEVVHAIRAKYGNRIRFVFRQFPLSHIHPFAERMAEASECAGDQGKFWEAIDKIYSRQTDTTDEGLRRDAEEIGLDMGKFDQCMGSGAEAVRVRRDHEDGVALGVQGTPTFYVGREVVPDVPSIDDLSRYIDKELMAEGSGAPAPASAQNAVAPATPAVKDAAKDSATPRPEAQSSSTPGATSAPGGSSFGGFGTNAFSGFGGGQQVCSEAEAAMKQPTLIDSNQLRPLLTGNPKPLFVDVRPAKEFSADKIPGAINIPLNDMPQRWSSLPKDRMLIFYEAGTSGDICASARAAARTVLEKGYPFDHVKVYQEGLAGWEKSGLVAAK